MWPTTARNEVIGLIFLEYEDFRMKYLQAQHRYDQVITEKEILFEKTQPSSMKFDMERVAGGSPENRFDVYLINLERKKIDARLAEAKAILEERLNLLKIKENDLRESNDALDRLYCLRVLDGMKIQKITRDLNYSESQVYRLLSQIHSGMVNVRENGTK